MEQTDKVFYLEEEAMNLTHKVIDNVIINEIGNYLQFDQVLTTDAVGPAISILDEVITNMTVQMSLDLINVPHIPVDLSEQIDNGPSSIELHLSNLDSKSSGNVSSDEEDTCRNKIVSPKTNTSALVTTDYSSYNMSRLHRQELLTRSIPNNQHKFTPKKHGLSLS